MLEMIFMAYYISINNMKHCHHFQARGELTFLLFFMLKAAALLFDRFSTILFAMLLDLAVDSLKPGRLVLEHGQENYFGVQSISADDDLALLQNALCFI